MKRIPLPYLIRAVDDHGSNASHSFGIITIRKNLRFALPILGQEIAEEDFYWLRIRLPMAAILTLGAVFLWPSAATAGVSIVAYCALALAAWFVACKLLQIIPPLHREMELRGHAVEAAWAEALFAEGMGEISPESYWYSEARALSTYKQFRGISATRIYDLLHEKRRWAQAWVKANRASISANHAHKFPNRIGA